MMAIAEQEIPVIRSLEALEIVFERYEHPPVMTVEEAARYDGSFHGAQCKNLFLRDKKGRNHFLVIMLAETNLDVSKLGENLDHSHLSFASHERLFKYLGLTPGAVSPFGLIHDTGHEVTVILDQALLLCDYAGFHPNVNTATLILKVSDLLKFLEFYGNKMVVMDFD